MKKVSKNTRSLKGGNGMNQIKKYGIIGVILIPFLLFLQGCTSSTGSSSSGASGSITRIQILTAASSLQASQQSNTTDSSGNTTTLYTWSSTFTTVVVRDNGGNLVPAGVPVNIVCGAGFLGDIPDPANPVSSISLLTNGNGQVQVKYTAGFTTGTASISATALGNSGSTTISIVQ